MSRVSLEYRLVVATIYRRISVVMGNGSTISNATILSGPDAGKSCSLRRQQYLGLFFAQFGPVIIIRSMLAPILG